MCSSDLPKFVEQGAEPTPEALRAMAQALEADSLRYLSVEAIARAIGLPADHLCRACVTGQYPTAKGRELYQIALARRDAPQVGRTYEQAVVPAACAAVE